MDFNYISLQLFRTANVTVSRNHRRLLKANDRAACARPTRLIPGHMYKLSSGIQHSQFYPAPSLIDFHQYNVAKLEQLGVPAIQKTMPMCSANFHI